MGIFLQQLALFASNLVLPRCSCVVYVFSYSLTNTKCEKCYCGSKYGSSDDVTKVMQIVKMGTMSYWCVIHDF
jgi:hypothetical protein